IPAMRVFSRNHVALMIAVVYTAVIVGWIGITFIMQVVLYPVEVQDGSVFELLSYYVDHRGYIGLDHGTKGIVFLISSYVPLHFIYSSANRSFHRSNFWHAQHAYSQFGFFSTSLYSGIFNWHAGKYGNNFSCRLFI